MCQRHLQHAAKHIESVTARPVQLYPRTGLLGPSLAPLALGDDFIFLEELLSGLGEALFRKQDPGVILAAQFEIPDLGKLGRQRQALPLRRRAPLLAADRRHTLPDAAVTAPVELNLSVQNLMAFHGPAPKRRR